MSGVTSAPPVASSPSQPAPGDFRGRVEQAMARAEAVPTPKAPKLAELPQAPSFQPPQSPLQGLQTWGTVLAVLGSFLTRAPLTSAIRSAAASMQAFQQGDQRGYQFHRQQFSDDLNRAIAQNNQEIQSYRGAIEASKTDVEKALAEVRGYAGLYHDQVMQSVAGIAAASRLAAARMQAGARLEAVRAQLAENERTNQIRLVSSLVAQGYNVPTSLLKEYGLAGPDAADPGPGNMPGRPTPDPQEGFKSAIPGVMSMREAIQTGPLSPPLETEAYMIANYQLDPNRAMSGLGASGKILGGRIMSEVARINPKFNAKFYQAQQGALDYYYKGQGAQLIRSYSTAVYHMDSLRELVDQLRNTSQPIGNFVINWAKRAYGNPNITNFDVAKTLVAGELTTALRGSQGAEADIERFEKELSPNMTPAQLRGALATVAKLLSGRLKVIDAQIQSTTGLDEGGKLIPALVRQSLANLEAGVTAPRDASAGRGIPMGDVPSGWQWRSGPNGQMIVAPPGSNAWQPVVQ